MGATENNQVIDFCIILFIIRHLAVILDESISPSISAHFHLFFAQWYDNVDRQIQCCTESYCAIDGEVRQDEAFRRDGGVVDQRMERAPASRALSSATVERHRTMVGQFDLHVIVRPGIPRAALAVNPRMHSASLNGECA